MTATNEEKGADEMGQITSVIDHNISHAEGEKKWKRKMKDLR